jgi:type II secretory pathway component PulM
MSRFAALNQQWRKLQPRERTGIALASALVLVYALWAWWWLPAWQVLQSAPAQHRALDETLARMVHMQQQAQALRSTPANAEPTQERLKRSLPQLGDAAKLDVQGEQLTVNLKNIAPTQLSAWLKSLQDQRLAIEGGQLQAANGLWSGRLNFKGRAP